MSTAKKIVLLFSFILFCAIIWHSFKWGQEESMPVPENRVTINSPGMKRPLYLRARVWGLAGNHEEIVLSESIKAITEKGVDYIFYTSDIYFKTNSDGQLILYAPESSISEPANKFPNIEIKKLTSAGEIADYDLNYKKYRLKRMSVYD